MPTPRIAIHGCYNSANFGDLLLLDLMAMHIERTHGIRSVCPWIAPSQRDEIAAVPGRGLRDCFGLDAAVFGGGGYFGDAGGRTGRRRLLRYSVPAAIWRFTRVPYVVVGVGAGANPSPTGMRRLRAICAGARAVCPRDEESRDILVKGGVDPARLEVTADLVLGMSRDELPQRACEEAARLLGLEDGRHRRRRIGLHLPLVGRDAEFMEAAMSAVLAALEGRDDVEAIWLSDHGTDHLEIARQRCTGRIPHLRFIERQDHWTTVALIAGLDGVLTSKLHVGITAWAMGVPACGFSTHSKSTRLYRQIGRSGFQMMAGPDAGPLTEWLRLCADDLDAFSAEDPIARRELPLRARRNYAIVDELIRSVAKG